MPAKHVDLNNHYTVTLQYEAITQYEISSCVMSVQSRRLGWKGNSTERLSACSSPCDLN